MMKRCGLRRSWQRINFFTSHCEMMPSRFQLCGIFFIIQETAHTVLRSNANPERVSGFVVLDAVDCFIMVLRQ